MITEWLISIGIAIGDWFVSLMPDFDVPPEFVALDDNVSGFFDSFAGLGVWVPWALVMICILVALGSWVIGVTVKTIRAVASYIPFFGGAG